MATNPKFVKLLEGIKNATSEGRADWTETYEHEFRSDLDKANLSIIYGISDDTEKPVYSVYLYDKKGLPLEQLSSEDDEEKNFPLLQSLFELAKRRARKVDELLDNLIEDVNTRRSTSKR